MKLRGRHFSSNSIGEFVDAIYHTVVPNLYAALVYFVINYY